MQGSGKSSQYSRKRLRIIAEWVSERAVLYRPPAPRRAQLRMITPRRAENLLKSAVLASAYLQIQERTQDAPHGGQLIRRDGAKTAVKALICHRARVFGPGEGGKLAQAGRLRGDRNLVTQAPVPARDGYHEDDRVRQRQVQRARNDDDRPAASLFRSDDRIQVSQPDIARTQRLAHSLSSPSPAV